MKTKTNTKQRSNKGSSHSLPLLPCKVADAHHSSDDVMEQTQNVLKSLISQKTCDHVLYNLKRVLNL